MTGIKLAATASSYVHNTCLVTRLYSLAKTLQPVKTISNAYLCNTLTSIFRN